MEAHQTSNLGVLGSSPSRVVFDCFFSYIIFQFDRGLIFLHFIFNIYDSYFHINESIVRKNILVLIFIKNANDFYYIFKDN